MSMEAGGKARANFLLHDVLLRPGKYFVGIWIGRHVDSGTIDHIEHAVTMDVMETEDTTMNSIVYPGVYLCRFEQSVSVG